MQQFIRDYGLRLRSERRTQIITGIVVLAIVWLMFGDGSVRRRSAKPQPNVQVGSNDPQENWRDLIDRFNGQLNQLTAVSNANREDIDNLKKSMNEYEATTAEIFKKILERLAEVQNATITNGANGAQARNLDDMADSDVNGLQSADELEPIGGGEQIAAQPPAKPTPRKLAYIGPGDSVRVKLLAGVNAPTDGTPYPVVFKLIGDIVGPDGTSLPLGEARLIAASQGSLTDSRALFRMTKISLRLPNGRRKEFSVDGWVVGEDGIRGMEGILIDPIGKAIAGAAMAGGLAGLGEGIAAANTDTRRTFYGDETSVDASNVPEYAGGVALASAATEWQRIIQDRVAQLTPVVQVLSGREGTAVFSQSLAIPDLYEQLDEEEPAVAFNSLD